MLGCRFALLRCELAASLGDRTAFVCFILFVLEAR
jgi:hypothetical protein